MKAKSLFKGFLGLSLLLSLSAPSFADEYKDEPRELRPAILDTDLDDLESIGTVRDTSEGALGRGLWSDSQRPDVIQLVKVMPEPLINMPASKYLSWGVLRTRANARLLEDGPNGFQPGQDILTARLDKLLSFGAYKDAQEMYSMMGEEPYTPDLARLGLLAMLYNGERSVACLEYKVVEDRDFSGDFWKNMAAYCAHVLEEPQAKVLLSAAPSVTLKKITGNKNYMRQYSAGTFGKMDDFDRALLIAEKRLDRPKIGPKTAAAMPLQDLGLFLHNSDLSDTERFFVEARAATWGLISTSDLKNTYQEFYNESFSGKLQEWQKLVVGYMDINDADKGRAQWNIFLNAYEKAELYGMGAILTYAERIRRFDINHLNKSEILKAIKTLHHADVAIPRDWSDYFLKKKNKKFVDADLALIGLIATPNYRLDDDDAAAVTQILQQKKEYYSKVVKIIIENLDKDLPYIHNAARSYEKHFDLTFNDNYVMPTLRVWDRLNESGQNGQIGTTILLSAQILQGWNSGNQYPGFVRDVFENLNSVGLTNVTQSLALGMVLDYI